ASMRAGGMGVLGVPVTLRQVFNLQREFRRSYFDRRRIRDAETNLNINAHYSLSHAATTSTARGQLYRPSDGPTHRQQEARTVSAQPSPAPHLPKPVLSL